MLKLWSPALLTRYAQLLRRPAKRHVAGLLFAIFLLLKLRQQLRARRATMSRSKKAPPSIPGFTALSDQVFVRNPENPDSEPVPAEHPEVVIVYGWGDGLPKHVVKYAEGFRVLFPRSKQILVLSPIAKAMFTDLHQRTQFMMPVVRELFPSGPDAEGAPRRILAHAMSNTGAVNYAATLNGFRELYNAPLPHQLFSMDSTPGSTDLTVNNVVRWSRAMSLGTAGFFPWPFVVTQSIFAIFLFIKGNLDGLRGIESPGGWSWKAANNEAYETREARKLYMYSKEDDLIYWKDIESHAAETRSLGWQADVEVFEGSGHVGHMRMHGEQYWSAILASWNRGVTGQVAA
ncbi:hypothetical protein ACRE_053120 [Hapsidospora chrysogenum ATCC 11550]|uniref:Uncharacterized protein n=1 Tax=Hapsidospora chrysogenum (strain ATCC 11550 / CBS 779.69 / DSM 880 / IAM 14645 / JCM 23072 / IMI 49137) TaxID=857340 RepID=A0A086T3G2_HAPC1|nr:hypothetical protein ACRE_053120 [Hapsidospora chrysogenum ATCC 11550]